MFIITQGFLSALTITQGYGAGNIPPPPPPPPPPPNPVVPYIGGSAGGGGDTHVLPSRMELDERERLHPKQKEDDDGVPIALVLLLLEDD